MNILTVELNALKFHSYHGLYEGEALAGSDYEVSLSASYNAPDVFSSLIDMIDYGILFSIVQAAMSKHFPLLEQVADHILQDIKLKYPQVLRASISIYKLQAPIPSMQGSVGITLHKKYDA